MFVMAFWLRDLSLDARRRVLSGDCPRDFCALFVRARFALFRATGTRPIRQVIGYVTNYFNKRPDAARRPGKPSKSARKLVFIGDLNAAAEGGFRLKCRGDCGTSYRSFAATILRMRNFASLLPIRRR
jgi:hypothetical protein